MLDATVVCRQLGYATALEVVTDTHFGNSTELYWLTDMQCTGMEQSISHCSHNLSLSSSCKLERNAGVVCGNGMFQSYKLDFYFYNFVFIIIFSG